MFQVFKIARASQGPGSPPGPLPHPVLVSPLDRAPACSHVEQATSSPCFLCFSLSGSLGGIRHESVRGRWAVAILLSEASTCDAKGAIDDGDIRGANPEHGALLSLSWESVSGGV